MKAKHPHVGKSIEGPSWAAAGFLVESMLLLVFLAVAMAMFFQLFGLSLARADEGEDLSRAVAAASSTAERFAANPSQAEGVYEVDDLIVNCDVAEEATDVGVLYTATIKVYTVGNEGPAGSSADPCYAISTTRYVSEVVR